MIGLSQIEGRLDGWLDRTSGCSGDSSGNVQVLRQGRYVGVNEICSIILREMKYFC